ncbi:DUF4221 domain-containing protein [Algoriphagus sp. AGSA1]|uniref:DUF4221 family protein n=1 Tax=Algoriphagus sp. AGSA1 TaxID=2907213 RepID=UPI001F371EF1|nr:DUF4221 family protein [Algoriphagus sp. AGSA1]MCE7055938.1 DUF4221 domain-containing protein [Algoriphagus sp. AGSA1]
MRKLLTISVLALLLSCGGKSDAEKSGTGNILENLSYSVDTVVVDSGDEFITIANEFQLELSSSLSKDNKTLYLFNNNDHKLSVVDLDQLKLREFLPFEKEGPNGVGEYVQSIQVLSNDQFLFTNFQATGIFDRNGKNLESFKLHKAEFDGLELDSPFNYQMLMTSDQNRLFSLTGYFNDGAKDLVKLNPKERTGEIIDLPALDVASDFSVMMSDRSIMAVPQSSLREINGTLFISNEVTSSVYRYDYQKDSLQLTTFQHQLVQNAKTGSLKNEVSSQDEFFAETAKSSSQISFHKFMWDESRRQFFRLGHKIISSTIEDISDIENKESYKSIIYLFVYDSELNLLGETIFEKITQRPRFYFFKDGKLYSYVNVEDELGFAVFTFNF